MKIVANDSEPPVLIPVVLNPVEVQLTLRIVAVEVRDVAVTVRILPDRTSVQNIV